MAIPSRPNGLFFFCARLVYTKWSLMSTRESNPRPHPYSVRTKRPLFFVALVSSTRNGHLCNDCRLASHSAMLKTRVFLLLGLLPPPWGTLLAALESLLWLIGVPYRVDGCSKHVYFCCAGLWGAHCDLYWFYCDLYWFLCSSLWLYSSSTGLRFMLLGLCFVLSP